MDWYDFLTDYMFSLLVNENTAIFTDSGTPNY